MSRSITFMVTLLAGLTIAAVFAYNVFHGSFDTARFEIEKVQWSSARQAAILAKRHDKKGYSSDQYFVLFGNHLLSPRELRYAYYHNGVVFRAGGNCLAMHWADSEHLRISCSKPEIAQDEIAIQRYRSGPVQISYDNIPAAKASE